MIVASSHGSKRLRVTRMVDLRLAEAPDFEQVRRALAAHGGPYISLHGGPYLYTADLRPDLWPSRRRVHV